MDNSGYNIFSLQASRPMFASVASVNMEFQIENMEFQIKNMEFGGLGGYIRVEYRYLAPSQL